MSRKPTHPPPSSSSTSTSMTVEYHRPSRQSIQEYNDLLNDANIAAQAAQMHSTTTGGGTYPNNYQQQLDHPPSRDHSPSHSLSGAGPGIGGPHHLGLPSRPAPAPPMASPNQISTASIYSNRRSIHNKLTRNPTRDRNDFAKEREQRDPFASSVPSTPINGSGGGVPPPRPSRANTATLQDMYTESPVDSVSSQTLDGGGGGGSMWSALASPVSTAPSSMAMVDQNFAALDLASQPNRARSNTSQNRANKKSVLASIFSSSKRPEISTPYDPVHLTHVGFNTSTGEFTGLPKEWQQLLQESGISRQEQERNPQAVMVYCFFIRSLISNKS
jgi:p21-activated kinase 1